MKVPLSSFLQEVSDKTTINDQYPVLTSSKAGLFLQSDYFNKQVASRENIGYKIIRRGQFTYRAMSDTGEFFPNMLECADIGIVSPAYPVFEITKPDLVFSDYLKFFFKSDVFQHSISAFAQGSTRTSVKFSKMQTVMISLPSIDEQRKIVEALKSVQKLVTTRETTLSTYDELIKARFVELLGDPEFNNHGWPVKQLGELCTVGSSKRIYQEEQSAIGVPFWRISDLISKLDTGSVEPSLYIPEEIYDKLNEQGLVPKSGDILVTSRGTLGRCYIVLEDDRFYFQDGMISWLSKYTDEVTPLYIQYLFDMPSYRKQIDSMQAGSTVAYLSIAMLKKLNVMLPDLESQKQFADFVFQVDKSKLIVLHLFPFPAGLH